MTACVVAKKCHSGRPWQGWNHQGLIDTCFSGLIIWPQKLQRKPVLGLTGYNTEASERPRGILPTYTAGSLHSIIYLMVSQGMPQTVLPLVIEKLCTFTKRALATCPNNRPSFRPKRDTCARPKLVNNSHTQENVLQLLLGWQDSVPLISLHLTKSTSIKQGKIKICFSLHVRACMCACVCIHLYVSMAMYIQCLLYI